MTLTRLMSQTATVVHRGEVGADEMNNPVLTETSRTTHPCYLEQRTGEEELRNRNTQIGDWLVVLPADVVIDGNDQVEVDGLTFEVVGPPEKVRTPRGLHHLEASLRHISG